MRGHGTQDIDRRGRKNKLKLGLRVLNSQTTLRTFGATEWHGKLRDPSPKGSPWLILNPNYVLENITIS
jgi:hypothetical protein